MSRIKPYLPLILALALAAAVKAALIVTESVPFNGDEAVIANMARHILQGERPVFFYGQAYMGSLDAWLIAGAFKLVGERVLAIRLVHGGLYLLYIVTLWWLARMWFEDELIPALVVILASIPTVMATLYTTATLGGYGESLVLGNLVLGLGYQVTDGKRQRVWWAWLGLGLAAGLGLWTLGMMGIYLLPVGLVGLSQFKWKKAPYYLLAAVGLFAGSLPWWLYNFQHDWEAMQMMFEPNLYQSTFFERVLHFLLFGLPAFLGLRFPWANGYLPWALVGLGLAFYTALAVYTLGVMRRGEYRGDAAGRRLIFLFVGVFAIFYFGSRYGVDVTGRYALPMLVPLFFAMAEMIAAAWRRRAAFGVGLVALVLGLNLAGIWLGATSPDRITTQFDPISSFDNSYDAELIDFLREHDELRGYTNYWVNFRLAFYTQDEILYSAELPYKLEMSYTDWDMRYPPYTEAADASDRTAYITTKHPALDEVIRGEFARLGVTYREEQIGPYHIFYDLSRAVRPEEIGFGGTLE